MSANRLFPIPVAMASIVVLLAVLTSGAAALEPTGETAELNGSREASCLLRIPGNDLAIPLDQDFLQSVVMTTAVRGAAIRDATHRGGSILFDEGFVTTQVDVISGPQLAGDAFAPTIARLTVHLEVEDPEGNPIPPVAEQLQSAIVERLRESLVQLSEQNTKSLQDMIAVSETRLATARRHLQELQVRRKTASEAADRIDLDRRNVIEEVGQLEGQLRDLEIERVAQRARQAAIEAQIAKSAEQCQKSAEQDLVLPELEQLADIQRGRLERFSKLHETQHASVEEVNAANEEMIEARIRLQERREELMNHETGAAQLSGELAGIAVASAELEARTAFIRDRLKLLGRQLSLADQLDVEVSIELPAASQAVQEEIVRLQNLRSRFATLQPLRIDVVGVAADGPESEADTR